MVFLDGFLTGLLLQVAIGPVFFFILNIALSRSILDAYAAVGAAVLVDYLYIALAVIGVGKALENRRIKTLLGLVGAAVLGVFGWLMIQGPENGVLGVQIATGSANLLSSFLSTLMLTISSPMTIIFWTGIFASKAVQKGYTRKELIPFGIAAGLATVVFLGVTITGLYLLKYAIPESLIRYLNSAVGVILILYAVIRTGSLIREWIAGGHSLG